MKRTTSFLFALAVATVTPLLAQEQSKQPCDPNLPQNWEWIFYFPQEPQKGTPITVSKESLTDGRNVSVDLPLEMKDWYLAKVVEIMKDPRFAGKQFESLAIYRNVCADLLVIKTPDTEYLLPGPGTTSPTQSPEAPDLRDLQPRIKWYHRGALFGADYGPLALAAAGFGNWTVPAIIGAKAISQMFVKPKLNRWAYTQAPPAIYSPTPKKGSMTFDMSGRWWERSQNPW